MADAAAMVEIIGKQSVSGPAGVAAGALGAVEAAAGKAGGVLVSVAGAAARAAAALATVSAAGIVGGLTAATTAAAGFESKMSAVAAVSGAGAQQMKELSGLALKLGADTSFSASEAAQGIGELSKAGVSLADIMGGAAKGSLDLAAAGGVSVAEAAEIASNAMNVFGIKGKDMAHVADQIAGAANASAIDVNDYKFSLSAAGAVAATVGVNFEDLTTSIAVLGQAGLKGSDAGTSLKTMLMNLQPSTKAQTAEFRRLGLITKDGANAFFDASGKAKGMAEIAGILQDATKGMSEQQRLASLEILFGTDAIRAAAIMAKAGAGGFREMAGAIGQVAAADVAEKRLDNLAGSIEKFKGSAETAGITVGQHLLPPLRRLVDAGTELINRALPGLDRYGAVLGSTFDALVTRVLAAGPALQRAAGAVQAAGRTMLDLGRYVRAVAQDGDYLNDWLTHLPGPLARVAVAIGDGVVGAFALLKAAAPPVLGALTGLQAAVGGLLGLDPGAYASAWDMLGGVIVRAVALATPVVRVLADLLAQQWAGNLQFLSTYVLPAFYDVAVQTFGFLRDMAGPLANIAGALRTQLGETLLWVGTTAWPALLNIARQTADWFNANLVPLLPALGDMLRNTVGGALVWLAQTGWPAMLGAATAALAWVQGTGLPALSALWDWLGPQLSAALGWLSGTGWPALLAAGATVTQWVTGTAVPALSALWDWLSPKLATAATWLSGTAWPALVSAGQAVTGWVLGTAVPSLTSLVEWLGPKVAGVVSWLTDTGWPTLVAAATKVSDWITQTAIPALTPLVMWMGDKLRAAASWLYETGWPLLVSTGAKVSDWVRDTAVPQLSNLWSWLEEKTRPVVAWFTETGWPALERTGRTVALMWRDLNDYLHDFWTALERRGVLTDLSKAFDALWAAGKVLVETFWPQMIGGDGAGARGAFTATDVFVTLIKGASGFLLAFATGVETIAKAFKFLKEQIDLIPDWMKDVLRNGAPMLGPVGGIITSAVGSGRQNQSAIGAASSGAGGLNYAAGSWESKAFAAAVKAGHPNPTEFVEQIRLESANFDPDVISGKRASAAGALGIAQIMPNVAKAEGVNALDPEAALAYAARRMAQAYQTYGNSDDALASYNMGAGNLKKYGAHGLAETDKYIRIIQEQAIRAAASGSTGQERMSSQGSYSSQNMASSTFSIGNQFELGLPMADALSACGPAAVAIFMQMMGRTPNAQEVMKIAAKNGWTAERGMGGPQAFLNTLTEMAIEAAADWTPTQAEAAQSVSSGRGVAFSTAGGAGLPLSEGHYFVAQGYDQETGMFDFGETAGPDPNNPNAGHALRGGSRYMTYEQVVAMAGPVQALITLLNDVPAATDAAGQGITGLGTATTGTGTAFDGAAGAVADMAAGIDVGTDLIAQGATIKMRYFGDELITRVTSASGTVINTITDLKGNVVDQFGQMADGSLLDLKTMGSTATSTVDEMAGTITTRMQDVNGTVVTTVTDMSGKVLSQTATMGQQAGANITAIGSAAQGVISPLDALGLTMGNLKAPNTQPIVTAFSAAERAADEAAEAAREYAEYLADIDNWDWDTEKQRKVKREYTPASSDDKKKRASGGPIWAGSWLVGEEGPEIVNFGAGATGNVMNAADTRRVLYGGDMGNQAGAQGAGYDEGALARAIARELAGVLPDGATTVQVHGAGTEETTAAVLGYLRRRDTHTRARRRREQV